VKRFDVIVIGKGLIGSAAAKYISAAQPNIAIIGPDEPRDNENALVFASHYDQSRLQRLIGKDEAWTKLNIDSVNQYDTIRQQSGIEFHDPVGCLYVQPFGTDNYLANAKSIGDLFKTSFRTFYSGNEINSEYKEFSFPESSNAMFESSPAGLINPRLLVKAQLKILEENRGTVIRDTVINISHIGTEYLVETSEGSSYFAHKIVLAPGSFINYFNLLQQKPDLVVKSEVILLARLNEEDALQLSTLPSLLYEMDNGIVEGIYLARPVKYPDGNWYLKMGCNMPEDILFENISEVQHWFRQGDSDRFMPRMTEALMNIMPGLRPDAFMTKRCIINRSVHGRPYIGETTHQGLYIASGCNGYSAMCSDAIGNLASGLILNGAFPHGYMPSSFEPVYKA
jgi:glycine/D-amino acid oxidase-like deaminating enzyme